jgi:hypothetical protein
MIPTWGAIKDGKVKRIPYPDLSDDHLKNIIRDGYRNSDIMEEAKKRGMEVPERPVDRLTYQDHMVWLESFASCSLSGNDMASEMVKLHDENRAVYLLRLNQLLETKTRK